MSTLLLLPPRHSPDSQAIWRQAIQRGWKTHRLQTWEINQGAFEEFDAVVFYGEPIFADAVSEQLGLSLDEPPVDWLATLDEKWLSRKVGSGTLARVDQAALPCFLKPHQPKAFEAKIYTSVNRLMDEQHLPGDTQVLTSTPVSWATEFRCFCLGGRVLASSPYLRNGELAISDKGQWPFEPGEEEAVESFCEAVLHKNASSLPAAVVIDVGQVSGSGWAVVEANAAWGSGLYGCDPSLALDVIQAACHARFNA